MISEIEAFEQGILIVFAPFAHSRNIVPERAFVFLF
jgi:hypothetical protein